MGECWLRERRMRDLRASCEICMRNSGERVGAHIRVKNGVGRFSIPKQSLDRNLRFSWMENGHGAARTVIESASAAKTRSIHQGAKERDECFCFGGGGAAINKRRLFVRRICDRVRAAKL